MGYSQGDAAHDAADAERAEEALTGARDAACTIAKSFNGQWEDNGLSPTVTVDLDAGAEGQPVFVFSLLLDLDDDLDAGDYPLDQLEKLQGDLRARIIDTSVDQWDWLVTTGTKAGAARQ